MRQKLSLDMVDGPMRARAPGRIDSRPGAATPSTLAAPMRQPPRARPGQRADASVSPGRCESAAGAGAELEDLAARVGRLTVCRTDPHRFFEERSEISRALTELARRMPR